MSTVIPASQLNGEHVGSIVQFEITTSRTHPATRAEVAGRIATVSHDSGHAYLVLRGISPASPLNELRGPTGNEFVIDHGDNVAIDAFELVASR